VFLLSRIGIQLYFYRLKQQEKLIDEERLTSNDPEISAAAAAAPASPHVLPPSYRHKRLLCAHFKQRATSSAGGGNQALPDIKAGESVATISPEKLAEISEVSGVRFLILAVLYQRCSGLIQYFSFLPSHRSSLRLGAVDYPHNNT
jgi:hypothetical protein